MPSECNRSLLRRFLRRIDVDDSKQCWNWRGNRTFQGYGSLMDNKLTVLAHRMSFSIFNGNLLDNKQIDHLCRNILCVNPRHLEQVTQKENILRGESIAAKYSRRTHCKNGHAFLPSNLLKTHSSRRCKTCCRERQRK